jgi:anti-sigma regulatory factor (Ser/Thr protein kinase)
MVLQMFTQMFLRLHDPGVRIKSVFRQRPSRPVHPAMVDGEWRLLSSLELGALPGAVPCARLHTKQVLWEWGLLRVFGEDAELIVSELVTNALQACPPADAVRALRLRLSFDGSGLLIQVQDGNVDPPAHTSADGDEEGGRGLLIVDAICTEWGWHPREDKPGKTVWALIQR